MAVKNHKEHGEHGEHHFEFFGPHGTALMLVLLPATLYFLLAATTPGCVPELSLSAPFVVFPSLPAWVAEPAQLFALDAFAYTALWFAALAVLYYVVPTAPMRGTRLADGSHLLYRCNALGSSAALAALLLYLWSSHLLRLSWAYDHLPQLLTASTVWAYLLALYLYVRGADGSDAAHGGSTGYPVYDFFMGRQLNPRDLRGSFDWKFFCELRPGLIGWVFLNLACAAKQREIHGEVTASMWLVQAFQAYYVFDALLNESSILTTMDITTDGFGLMLTVGDLAWVPFTYTLQARYLVVHPTALSAPYVAFVLALQLAGLYIFRASNSQKDTFRNDPTHPSVRDLPFIRTETGSRLLAGGWWGASRHPNYLGDWLMSVAWSLPCGFAHPWAYFYPAYFAVLLIHRQLRDDHKCSTKYGKDWERYCKQVPYRIIPYVY